MYTVKLTAEELGVVMACIAHTLSTLPHDSKERAELRALLEKYQALV